MTSNSEMQMVDAYCIEQLTFAVEAEEKNFDGVVYCAKPREFEYVKIGFTGLVADVRISKLQTFWPTQIDTLAAFPASKTLEQRIMAILHLWHVRGEWFHASPTVLAAAAFLQFRTSSKQLAMAEGAKSIMNKRRSASSVSPMSFAELENKDKGAKS